MSIGPALHAATLTTLILAGASEAAREVAGDAAYDAKHLTSSEALEDVVILRRALTRLHPGYDRYTSAAALGLALDELEDRAAASTTDADLYLGVSAVLGRIRCGHTKAELPEPLADHRRTTSTYLPFTITVVEGRMFVDRVDPAQAGLSRGDEVLAINDRAAATVIADVEPYLAVDGWTDHAKRSEIEHSSELMGDAIDHFGPLLYGWTDRFTIDLRSQRDDRPARVDVDAVDYERWLEIATDGAARYVDFKDAVVFRRLDDMTAYLSIGTFVNYRDTVDPVTVLGPHFDAMRDAGIEHLILDLRQCGGGSTDVPAVLTSYLVDRPVRTARRHAWVRSYRVGALRPYLSTWDEAIFDLPDQLFVDLGNGFFEMNAAIDPIGLIEPRPDRFDGRLTILTSVNNASGATNLIAVLRDANENVRLVGEPTGGSADGTTAGVIFFLKLPNSGITVRIPAIRSFNNVSSFRPGYGVTPDVRVDRSIEDFRTRRDAALATAIELPRPPAVDRARSPAKARLDTLFSSLHERGEFFGSVLVAERGSIVYEASFGLADDASGEPLDVRSRFQIASVTKPFTAMAIMLLKQDGALGYDDPVAMHLPDFPYPTVTIRHLLTHTSGLPLQFADMGLVLDEAPIADNAVILALLAKHAPPLATRPAPRSNTATSAT